MCRHRGCRWTAIFVAVLFSTATVTAEDDAPTLEPRETWTNAFADKQVELRFTVKTAKEWKGRAEWSLAAENDRTLTRGEADLTAAADKPAELIVKLRTPEVKPGVVLKTRLRVRLFVGGNPKPVATHERTLWIFPDDPFVHRRAWVKGLKITLFDPEKTTAEALKKLEVPFDELNNVAALGELKDGFLLVGEGVSFKDFPDLAEALTRTAANGLPVLCLAPAAGVFPVPGAAGVKGPQPRAVTWRRREHIGVLDERLDAAAWLPDGKVVVSTLALKAEDGVVVAEVGRGDDWPWFEAEFPTKTGRFIVCGFGLFGKSWDAGPTPRYLLARVLETMSPKTEVPKEKETDR